MRKTIIIAFFLSILTLSELLAWVRYEKSCEYQKVQQNESYGVFLERIEGEIILKMLEGEK